MMHIDQKINNMNNTKHYAVFGDTHGHLRLMFQLCRLWQLNHETFLDGIFQCGDLGYYPNPENIDRATKRFSIKDPEELGFKFFTKPEPIEKDPKLKEIISGKESGYENINCSVYFCHGNHEDFQSLSAEVLDSDIKSIDFFEKIFWLRPGYINNVGNVRLTTLGGGPVPPNTPDDDYSLDEPWKWVNNKACKSLEKTGKNNFDILISHISPKGGESTVTNRWGSDRLRRVIDTCQPSYNFFAHHKDRIEPYNIENTKCFWLNDVNFSRKKKGINMPIEKGCMGVLSWNDKKKNEFKIIDDKWMEDVNFTNWWRI